jgi:hypothetical protein
MNEKQTRFGLARFFLKAHIIGAMPTKNLSRKLRYGIGLSVFFISAFFLTWGLWPARQTRRQVSLPAMAITGAGGKSQNAFAASRLEVAWPERLQVGSTGQVLIVVGPEAGAAPVSQADQTGPAARIEARLESTGMLVAPDGAIQQSNQVDGRLVFRWQVRPVQSGVYPATVWLHLLDSSQPAEMEAKRRLLTVQSLEMHAISLMGINAYLAQVVGIIGVTLGAALCFDLLIRKK